MKTKITSPTKKSSQALVYGSFPFQYKLSSCCCPACCCWKTLFHCL